jgi:hypothetical protein
MQAAVQNCKPEELQSGNKVIPQCNIYVLSMLPLSRWQQQHERSLHPSS